MTEVIGRMNKLVGIYERKGQLFISPYHKTEAGFWIGDEKTVTVDRNNVAAIADATFAALSESREGVPTPPRDFDPVASLLSASGVASFSTFAKTAKSIAVELIDGVIEITPDQNKGSREGFVPMMDKKVCLPDGDPNFGMAIVAALEVAE